MSLANMVWQATLGEPLLVATGKIRTQNKQDVVAVGGRTIYVAIPDKERYILTDVVNVNQEVLSLDVGLPVLNLEHIFVGTSDRIIAYGNRQGTITRVWQSEPEKGANFTNLVLADVDGDGRQELIAAAEGNNTLYVYQLISQPTEEIRLEPLVIRQLPGKPLGLTTFRPTEATYDFIAISYQVNRTSEIFTLIYTERGFVEGPSTQNLPVLITELTAADLLTQPGEELAGAGGDGHVRILTSNRQLIIRLTTSNLGSTVSALKAETLGKERALLVAGTPGNYVFGFRRPVSAEPNWAFKSIGAINSLAIVKDENAPDRERVVVGTTNGFLQVWDIIN